MSNATPSHLRGGCLSVWRYLARTTGLRAPSATELSLPRVGAQFTAGIRRQERARIEPMMCPGAGENRWQGTGKFRIVRTAMVPQRLHRRPFRETQHFLHAPVAIRRDDEHCPWQGCRWRRERQHEIVMELALLRVLKQLMAAACAIHRCEKGAESEMRREALNGFHRAPYAAGSVLVSA